MTQGDYRDYMTVAKATRPPAGPLVAPKRRRSSGWIVLLAVSVVVVLVAVALVGLRLRAVPRDDRPVVLPTTFAGQPMVAAERQFDDAGWRAAMREVFDDHPYAGVQYGTVRSGPIVNVIAVRMDAADVSDAGVGVPPFTDHGLVRCTRTITIPERHGMPARTIEGVLLLCYRAAPTLTVSAFVIASAERADEATVARAVDEVWAQNASR